MEGPGAARNRQEEVASAFDEAARAPMAQNNQAWSARLPMATIEAVRQRAEGRGISQSAAMAELVADALDMRGRDGLEAKLAMREAEITELRSTIRRLTGRDAPRRVRTSLGMTVAEAGALDQAARQAGMTRGEFLRSRVFGDSAELGGGPTQRPLAKPARPALPTATKQ